MACPAGGQTHRLSPEDQDCSFYEGGLGVGVMPMRRHRDQRSVGGPRFEGGEPAVLNQIDVLPVVEPRSAYGLLVGAEAQWVDQVEARSDPQAQPSDVARIGRDLRLDERDMELRRHAQASAVSGSV